MTGTLRDIEITYDAHLNTISDLSDLYSLLWDLVEGFDSEFAPWNNISISVLNVGDSDLAGLREAIGDHSWDGPVPEIIQEDSE